MYIKYLESEVEQPKEYSDCELSPEDWENPVIFTQDYLINELESHKTALKGLTRLYNNLERQLEDHKHRSEELLKDNKLKTKHIKSLESILQRIQAKSDSDEYTEEILYE
jgi:hypothetical protein